MPRPRYHGAKTKNIMVLPMLPCCRAITLKKPVAPSTLGRKVGKYSHLNPISTALYRPVICPRNESAVLKGKPFSYRTVQAHTALYRPVTYQVYLSLFPGNLSLKLECDHKGLTKY